MKFLQILIVAIASNAMFVLDAQPQDNLATGQSNAIAVKFPPEVLKAYPDVVAIYGGISDLPIDSKRFWDGVTGAGIIISPEGHILSALHVIGTGDKRSQRIGVHVQVALASDIYGGRVRARMARVKALDQGLDLVMLQLTEVDKLPPVRNLGLNLLNEIQDALGADLGSDLKPNKKIVFTIGHMLTGERKAFELTRGIIEGVDTNHEYYVVNKRLLKGQSGAPLLNNKGELMGIVVKSNTAKPNTSYAVPIEFAESLFSAVGLDAGEKVVHSYRARIRSLNKEIDLLRAEVKRDEGAMNWLLTWLKWDITVCRNQSPEKRHGEDERALLVRWSKKFHVQEEPADEFGLVIYPLFENEHELLELEGRKTIEADVDANFSGKTYTVIPWIRKHINKAFERYRRFNGKAPPPTITMESVSKLKVTISVEVKEEVEEKQTRGNEERILHEFADIEKIVLYPSFNEVRNLRACPPIKRTFQTSMSSGRSGKATSPKAH